MKPDFILRRKVSWLVFFVLSLFLFLIYYTLLYPSVLWAYNHQLQKMPYLCDGSTLADGASPVFKCEDFSITVYFPKNLDNSGKQSIFLSIENKSASDLKGDLYLAFIHVDTRAPDSAETPDSENDQSQQGPENTANIDDKSIFPILIAEGSTATQKNEISLKPTSRYYLKQNFPFPGSLLKDTSYRLAIFIQSENQVLRYTPEFNLDLLEISSINAAIYILTEKILLPPLANIILPLLSIVCVWLLEERILTNSQDNLRLYDFLRLFFPSLTLATAIILTITLGIYQNSIIAILLTPFILLVGWLWIGKFLKRYHGALLKKIRQGIWQKRISVAVYFLFLIGFMVERATYFYNLYNNINLQNGQSTPSDTVGAYISVAFSLVALGLGIWLSRKGKINFHVYEEQNALPTSPEDTSQLVNLSSAIEQSQKEVLQTMNQVSETLQKQITDCCSSERAGLQRLEEQVAELQKTAQTTNHLDLILDNLNLLPEMLKLIRSFQAPNTNSIANNFSKEDREYLDKSLLAIIEQIQGIEKQMAENASSGKTLETEQEFDKLIKRFTAFLDAQGIREEGCVNCGFAIVPKNALYCPNCGENPTVKKLPLAPAP